MIEQWVKIWAEVIERGIFIDDADLQIRVPQLVVDESLRHPPFSAKKRATSSSLANSPLSAAVMRAAR